MQGMRFSGIRYSEAQKAYVSIDGCPLCIFCEHDNIQNNSCDKGVDFGVYAVNRSNVKMCGFFKFQMLLNY